MSRTDLLVKFSLAIKTRLDCCLFFSCSINLHNSGSVSVKEWLSAEPVDDVDEDDLAKERVMLRRSVGVTNERKEIIVVGLCIMFSIE